MRIGILASKSLNGFNIKVLEPIMNDENFSVELVIIDDRPEKSTKEKIIKNIKRGRGGYILIMGLKELLQKNNKNKKTESFFKEKNIPIIKVKKPYSNETLNKIKSFDLDVLLLRGGFGIIKEPLLDIPPKGVISYHHGDMRKYRGMPPAFWELYNGENEMGVTVQKLSKKLDQGIPLVEKKIEIRPTDDWKTLKSRAYEESVDMMYKALNKLDKENFQQESIDEVGELYTLPNFRQWMSLKLKVISRKIVNKFK